MADLPFMKLYWGDLLTDTSHLTNAELGLYVRILGRMWTSKRGLVADHHIHRLAALDRLEEINGSGNLLDIEEVKLLLTETEGGWTQKRLLSELKEAIARSKKLAEAGRKGGQAKAGLKPGTIDSDSELDSDSPAPQESLPARKKKAGGKTNGRKDPRKLTDVATWEPGEEDHRYAVDHGLDPDRVLQDIRDWAANAAASKRRKKDPHAFWQSWCRRDADRAGPGSGPGSGRGGKRSDADVLRDGAQWLASGGRIL